MSRGASDTIDVSVHKPGPREFIAIGVPSFGMVHLFWVARLMNLRMPMNTVIRWFYVVGKEVGEARNEIVAKALATETETFPPLRCRAVFFVDDDVLMHPNALLQLESRRRPIVSGLYYTKTDVPTPLALHDEGAGVARSWTPGDLIDVAGHGMGLTLIHADVFRRLQAERELGTDGHGYPAWFKTTRDQELLRADGAAVTFNQTEDMHFLGLARSIGYQPAVDTSAAAFAWHFDARRGLFYPQAQFEEWSTRGTITWPTDGEPVVWSNVA